MKQYTTNYFNTLITVAEDSNAACGTVPPIKGDRGTVASLQFGMIAQHPFEYTSDDVLFQVYAVRNAVLKKEYKARRKLFYSKGQPCMRTSPLVKTYGWGIYFDENGRIMLADSASESYARLLRDETVKKVPAMRSKK